jgi:hypothetical protein
MSVLFLSVSAETMTHPATHQDVVILDTVGLLAYRPSRPKLLVRH